ncbi:GTP-binding protein [Prototheca wickerhamii]|uniref:GTP-binding protein n=1 Tax=Prototheca wickerhamii TaxID=3111 RepID=A0AAD9MK34_PROWI|nr:GTP-binding protein [Prototheca wickerhamii]
MGILERIKEIEFEMARTQRNKATEYHLGQLKAKLAKLRTQLQEPAKGFEVQKYGDGRVALIGFPSVGKSTLLTQLTGTRSEAASYEFTTLTCIPGVIHYNDAKIQLLDLPGIIEGAAEGKGRGRQVIAVCKSADLLLMVLDAGKPHYHREILTRELESVGVRLNRRPPAITFHKKKTGGIAINTTVPLTHLDEKMVWRILQEYRIHNADLLFKEDCTVDDLIDVIEGNRRYIKCLYVYNKVDVCSMEEVDEVARRPHSIPISCYHQLNLDGLLRRIWAMMGLVRVYTKKVGARPDFDEPVVLSEDRNGIRIQDFCTHIHKSLVADFKYALVWGTSTKHMPQRVGMAHLLEDEDVVQIVKKKVTENDDARGRFKQTGSEYVKIADREKKKPLKT